MELNTDTRHLLALHEQKRNHAVKRAVDRVREEQGAFPAPFAFFMMGSAGRQEQLYESDQDHGIVFQGSEENQIYFLKLGEYIVIELEKAGYVRCSGGVMASEERWCRSLEKWEEQLEGWLVDDSFEHVRYVLTFFDARAVLGNGNFVTQLKAFLFQNIRAGTVKMERFAENTGRIPKALNAFGGRLAAPLGEEQGKMNMKEQVLFPYVNGMRLLALKEEIQAASTLQRMDDSLFVKAHEQDVMTSFATLLEKRAVWGKTLEAYTYLSKQELSKGERSQLKEWIKEGRLFYKSIQNEWYRRD